MNIFDLTPHQLDVLRTVFAGLGAIGTFVIGVNTVLTVLLRRLVKKTVNNTTTTQWSDGKLEPVSVAELAHRAAHTTEEIRGEVTHLATEAVPRLHGRRRQPTTPIRVSAPPPEESTYT